MNPPTSTSNDLSLVQFLDELDSLTRQGKLQWAETPDENTFICALTHGTVRISRLESFNDETGVVTHHWEAALLNDRGRVVQVLESDGGEADEYTARTMSELFDFARAQARNSEGLLKSLFAEVKSLHAG